MKYIRQFLMILVISCIGELLKLLLPLPVPASIYGMVLMFAALMSGIIKLEDVKDAASFLIEIMPVMFIPAGVGLLSSWSVLQPILPAVLIVVVITNLTVMLAAGKVSQMVIRKNKSSAKAEEVQGNE